MQNLEWTFTDKSSWPRGPWDSEPDKKQWTDAATDLPCLIVRNRSGALCGYVGVSEGHPLFSVGYSRCPGGCEDHWCEHRPESLVDAHGGLTFSSFCVEGERAERGICHIVEPGENDRVWWLGFDCAHSQDLTPALDAYWREPGLAYRDIAYVTAQCASLAAQLAAIGRA